MADRPHQTHRYTVTYAFSGNRRGASTDAISRIRETIAEHQHVGSTVEFLGATQTIDGDGHPSEVTVRYEATSKGSIAWLNWQAGLPACGPTQYDETQPPQAGNRDVAVAESERVEL